MLEDFGIPTNKFRVLCDNTSAINNAKNPVQHSRTKHIDIIYYFFMEIVVQGTCCLEYVHTIDQLSKILTKPLASYRFIDL